MPTTPNHRTRTRTDTRPRLNLALQGGGSHGAFTWGVLDRLLDDDGIDIAGLSGTSAGALNAAVALSGYVNGHAQGGVGEARRHAQLALRDFWQDVSHHGSLFSPVNAPALDLVTAPWGFTTASLMQWTGLLMRAWSPYQVNPLNLNPLRDVLQKHVQVDALHTGCARCGIPLFVTATSVRTGQARVFTAEALSLDALMASACLPFLFQSVEIDGEPFWDGGYTGNPALYPLIYRTELEDILLVRLNPLQREGTPMRSVDIMDRLSEITFNASLIGEMRAIAFVQRLLKDNKLEPGRYKGLRMHMVADDEGLAGFNASTKFNTDWPFLTQLHRLGREAAERWLRDHRDDIGQRNTLDIEKVFLNRPQP
ncbi:MAG: patatin-like phospholipase family protein [Burkholderiales bacterium]|nr:patatin-like phospholipase family protein [Burkholderiales bacterium]MBH2016586.1 patatin-like phospholipase family protein [Burkholderiales bacterium]